MTPIELSSLWGDDFLFKPKDNEKDIIEQVKKPKKVDSKKILDSKKLSIQEKIHYIERQVKEVLGKFIDNSIVIRTKEELSNYIDVAIKNGIIAIDTETNNSLDYLTCKLVGVCIYTENMKQAYIPINHTDSYTETRLPNQLTEQDIREQLDRLKNTKIIMHNGKFDYQVLKCTCNCVLDIYWDTMIASHLIDEEGSHKLKDLYVQLIDKSQEKYSITSLYGSIPYEFLPPDIFAPYSATDAYETYKVYKWQEDYFNKEENKELLPLLFEVEMPILKVVAEMELTGIQIDTDYANRLRAKYEPLRAKKEQDILEELTKLKPQIDSWKNSPAGKVLVGKKTKAQQLSDPIQVTSPTQLAILFYDILGVEPFYKKSPRGTGEDQLSEIYKKYGFKICNLILDLREFNKMLDTYIEKLPKIVGVDGRIHCSFNQLGTVTGRFSSSDPNL